MRRRFSLLLVLVLLVGVVGLAQTAVEPRAVGGGVLLFDNETGGAVTQLVIMFDQVVTLEASDIVAFGGGEVTQVTVSEVAFPASGAAAYSLVKIQVEVVAGGTLQLTLSGESADAQVVNAYWFE